MNFFKNLKWLFCDAPTGIKSDPTPRKCDYCDCTEGWTHWEATGMCLCHGCMKKIADKVLK